MNDGTRDRGQGIIRTVLGDVPASSTTVTLTHEHLLYGYPGAELDHRTVLDLDVVVPRIAAQVSSLVDDYGCNTLVDMTPAEVGRHPELMAEVARRTGMNVIAITGFFPERMGIPYYWRRQSIEELTEFFVRDLTEGMVFAWQQTPYRAGLVKIATGQESVTPAPSPVGAHGRRIHEVEDRVIRAAARAAQAVGCAVNTHVDPLDFDVTNPLIEQLEILEEEGLAPDRVIAGHAFINSTADQRREVCERGAFLQVDHIGIPWRVSDDVDIDEHIATAMLGLIADGFVDHLVLTYDRWFYNPRSTVTEADPKLNNENVGVGHMFTSFLPRLRDAGVSQADIDKMLIDNPRRAIAIR